MLKCNSPSLAIKQKGFQCSFETVHRLSITNVTWEAVPGCWSSMWVWDEVRHWKFLKKKHSNNPIH